MNWLSPRRLSAIIEVDVTRLFRKVIPMEIRLENRGQIAAPVITENQLVSTMGFPVVMTTVCS